MARIYLNFFDELAAWNLTITPVLNGWYIGHLRDLTELFDGETTVSQAEVGFGENPESALAAYWAKRQSNEDAAAAKLLQPGWTQAMVQNAIDAFQNSL